MITQIRHDSMSSPLPRTVALGHPSFRKRLFDSDRRGVHLAGGMS